MNFVRTADIEEVLRAAPEDDATRAVVRACPVFGVWTLCREDIGKINAQLPNGETGAVSSLFVRWKEWLRSPDPRVVWSSAVHAAFVQLLRDGQVFSVLPVVLGPSMQIHDGRHRLFAAYEYLSECDGAGRIEVFWDRVGQGLEGTTLLPRGE